MRPVIRLGRPLDALKLSTISANDYTAHAAQPILDTHPILVIEDKLLPIGAEDKQRGPILPELCRESLAPSPCSVDAWVLNLPFVFAQTLHFHALSNRARRRLQRALTDAFRKLLLLTALPLPRSLRPPRARPSRVHVRSLECQKG